MITLNDGIVMASFVNVFFFVVICMMMLYYYNAVKVMSEFDSLWKYTKEKFWDYSSEFSFEESHFYSFN